MAGGGARGGSRSRVKAPEVLDEDIDPRKPGSSSDRDARTITSREVIELLDKIVDRSSPAMANRTANILSQNVHVRHFTTQLFPIRRSISSNG
jgi:hypothetical protein